MKIGIIGSGRVGGGLGKLWARAGHQVFFSSRHPPGSFIPHSFYKTGRLQRLVAFYCSDHQFFKVAVHRLIADCGFVGLDAGPLRLARELEAPGRLHRAGLVEIAEATRLLKEIADSVQSGLDRRPSQQPLQRYP